jgi:hypothetical protein
MERRNALLAAAVLLGTAVVGSRLVGAQEAGGLDAYVQSGTCAAPGDVRINVTSERSHDVEPYEAEPNDGGDPIVLGYYGASTLPGFGFSVIYTDRPYSLVVEDDSGAARACGDLLEPDADRFREAGTAAVQLLPADGGTLQGIALIERTPMQREYDVVPTMVRIMLAEDTVPVTDAPVDGYDGVIEQRRCDETEASLRTSLRSRGEHDVRPYLAEQDGAAEPAVAAYYGSAGAPGFNLAALSTDKAVALVINDTDSGDAVACGDILEPEDDDLADAGVAMVRLVPSGDSTVQGFAVVERVGRQRELDVTPTRVRVLLLAPAIDAQ